MTYKGDGSRSLHELTRRARVVLYHRCTFCSGPIEPGQMYRSFAFIEEHRFRYKVCHLSFC